MIINIYYDKDIKGNLYQIGPYIRCREELEKYGVKLNFYENTLPLNSNSTVDIVAIKDSKFVNGFIPNHPTIIEKRNSSSRIIDKQLLNNPNVIQYNKICILKKDFVENLDKYDFFKMRQHSIQLEEKNIILNNYHKLNPNIHFGQFDRMSNSLNCAIKLLREDNFELKNKPIDIFCVMTVPKEQEVINHRMNFLNKIKSLKGLNVYAEIVDTRIPISKYLDLSMNSKISISPWGHGELCYRDFESFCCNNILIKPTTDGIHIRDNPFITNKTVFWCNSDASNLEEVIHKALQESTVEYRRDACSNIIKINTTEYISNNLIEDYKKLGIYK